MAQWGNSDAASNSAVFATMQVSKPVSASERNALYGNTTADAYQAGVTVGQYGVDRNEIKALRASGSSRPASPGWALRTEGTGGRAGRVHYETLVAFSHNAMQGDGADDAVVPDYFISITGQFIDASGSASGNEQINFALVAATTPTGFENTLSYAWEYTTTPGDTGTFATADGVSGFSGQGTNTLTADANTIADQTIVRVTVSGSGTTQTVVSDNATLTVTA